MGVRTDSTHATPVGGARDARSAGSSRSGESSGDGLVSVRLFVAVRPSDALVDAVWTAVRSAATVLEGEQTATLRWTRREHAHVTLAFCGAVDTRLLPVALAAVEEAVGGAGPLTCRLDGVVTCVSDRSRGGAVLWADVASSPQLADLADACVEALDRAGAGPDRRSFRPHLTVARTRQETGRAAFGEICRRYAGPAEAFVVDRVEVVRSHPGPDGATHEVIGAVVLG